MKKVILTALVATVAVAAQADGSLDASANGSSTVSSGIVGASSTTLTVIDGSIAYSVTKAEKGVSSAAAALRDASMYVLTTSPLQMSTDSYAASKAGAQFVLTTSGKVLVLVRDGSVAFLKDPVGASSTALDASDRAIQVTIDASGNVLKASGQALKDTYGADVTLIMTGSGELYTVSAGSVVAAYNNTVAFASAASTSAKNAASATLTFIDETSIDSIQVSAQAAYNMSVDAFNALTKSGKQYSK